VLPIFPEGSLVSSVVTTTWVGVFVLCFFNLRLGWGLSGIIVPGYLVPLLLVKPWAAAVITAEATATYLIVWTLSERFSMLGLWNSFFGRDRFFAIILTSIGVRLLFDVWLLPLIGEPLNAGLGLSFDYRNELHSFGLIIVALMANQFWKSGVLRSVVPMVVTIGLTYLIVRYGLIEFTNFRMSSLGFMYTELASSILATPKAYIVLVVTAFLASRMNLVYGWDFNGILIPALIALQWWQPWKVAASFVEAFIIYGVAVLLLCLPIFAKITVQGARKLLLFFNVGFAYKLALGWGLAVFAPSVKVTDYFAFGYLLSTLLAIKMHDKAIPARLTRATLQTSLTGVAVASLLGFGLTLLPQGELNERNTGLDTATIENGPGLGKHIDQTAIDAYGAGVTRALSRPSPTETAELRSAAEALIAYAKGGDAAMLERARQIFATIGYQLRRIDGNHLAAVDAKPARAWSGIIVQTGSGADLVVEVPDPLETPQLANAGLSLYRAMDARVLIVAGSSRSAPTATGLDPLQHHQSAFHAFHRAAAVRNVVQLRGQTRASDGTAENRLVVKSNLPAAMSADHLEGLLPRLDVRFGTGPGRNIQRKDMWSGFAELLLTPQGVTRLLRRQAGPTGPAPAELLEEMASPDLAALFDGAGDVAPEGSGEYRAPGMAQLLYLDSEVLKPLVKTAKTGLQGGAWTRPAEQALTRVRSAAEAVGYRVLEHRDGAHRFVILAEARDGRRSWGTLVLRAGLAQSLGFQVPRPLAEPGTLPTARELFRRSRARALLVSGAHPRAVPNRRADILRQRNAVNAFNLISQVLYRESGTAAFTAMQLRGFAPRPAVEPDAQPRVVIATADGATGRSELSAKQRQVIETLANPAKLAFADGSPAVADLEVGRTPQAGYLDQAENDSFMTIWVSRETRAGYRDKGKDALEAAHFRTLGMADTRSDVTASLAGVPLADPPGAAFVEAVRGYVRSRDVLALATLQKRWPVYRYERRVDPETGQSFLLAWSGKDHLALAASLASSASWSVSRIDAPALARSRVEGFARKRGGALVPRKEE